MIFFGTIGRIAAVLSLIGFASVAVAQDKGEQAAPGIDDVKAGCTKALGDFFKTNERYKTWQGSATKLCDCIVDRTAKNATISGEDKARLYSMYATKPRSEESKAARSKVSGDARRVSRGIVSACNKEVRQKS